MSTTLTVTLTPEETEKARKWVLEHIGLKVNLSLLNRVKKHIKEDYRRFDMEDWGYFLIGKLDETHPPCRTVACIAGWTKVLCSKEATKSPIFFSDAEDFAFKHLRLASDNLFYRSLWTRPFRQRYWSPSKEDKAAVAVAFLDFIIKTVRTARKTAAP